MAIKKILILATSRTGTTIIQEILSREFRIANLSELLNQLIKRLDYAKI